MVKDIEKQLEQKTKQQDKLARQTKDAEDNLADTKDKLVDVGRSIQKNEKDLAWLEYRIDKLETRQQDIEQNLDKDRESLAELVLAIERIRRMPPEAIFVKPGAPLKTAQTAMLLRDVIPAIHDRADALRDKLEEVREITQELKDKRDKVLSTSQKLETEQKDLSKLVKKRQTLYAATRSHFIKEQKSVQKISAQAQNLQELVKELEDNKKRQKAWTHPARPCNKNAAKSPFPKPGSRACRSWGASGWPITRKMILAQPARASISRVRRVRSSLRPWPGSCALPDRSSATETLSLLSMKKAIIALLQVSKKLIQWWDTAWMRESRLAFFPNPKTRPAPRFILNLGVMATPSTRPKNSPLLGNF